MINVNRIGPAAAREAASPRANTVTPPAASGSFESALAAAGVKLSAHAEKRLAAREITLGETHISRLGEAVNRAEEKGGRNSLILMDDLAFIVDVSKRTMVTALNSAQQKEGVFTHIDSVILAK
jgi:flagellar operon protein